MNALWTAIALIILGLAACFFIVHYYVSDLEKKKNLLLEACWERRNRTPLLLETLRGASAPFSKEAELIATRSKAMSQAFTFPELMALEKNLHELVNEVFRQSSGVKNTLLSALQQEFLQIENEISHRANDYNYVLEKLIKALSRPWFIFFKFLFQAPQNTPVSGV